MKAKVVRGVYVRGKAHAEGEIIELSPQEFTELKHTNYVVAAPADAPTAAAAPVTAAAPSTLHLPPQQASGKK